MTKKVKEPKAPKAAKASKPPKAGKAPKAPKPVKKGTITFGKKKDPDAPLVAAELPAFVPTLPSSDLLPQSIRDAVDLRKVRTQMIGFAVLVGVISALVFMGQQGLIFAANVRLTNETNTASTLASETKKYLPVRTFYGQVDSNSTQILTNMSKEVAFAKTFNTIASTSTAIKISTIDLSVDTTVGGAQNAVAPTTTTTEVAAGCPQINLFDPHSPAVGCVKITGSAKSRAELSRWVSDMEGESLFVSPFVSDSTADTKEIRFNASVGVTAKVFSMRYDKTYLDGTKK